MVFVISIEWPKKYTVPDFYCLMSEIDSDGDSILLLFLRLVTEKMIIWILLMINMTLFVIYFVIRVVRVITPTLEHWTLTSTIALFTQILIANFRLTKTYMSMKICHFLVLNFLRKKNMSKIWPQLLNAILQESTPGPLIGLTSPQFHHLKYWHRGRSDATKRMVCRFLFQTKQDIDN